MHKREITIIPATITKIESRYQKVPGKLRVIVYSKVIKGTDAGVQIRKNIRSIIAAHTDWDLIEVSTDYCQTENQEETWKNFLRILTMVRLKYIDAVIIYSGDEIESIFPAANTMFLYCMHFGVDLYISTNDKLLTSKCEEKLIV